MTKKNAYFREAAIYWNHESNAIFTSPLFKEKKVASATVNVEIVKGERIFKIFISGGPFTPLIVFSNGKGRLSLRLEELFDFLEEKDPDKQMEIWQKNNKAHKDK